MVMDRNSSDTVKGRKQILLRRGVAGVHLRGFAATVDNLRQKVACQPKLAPASARERRLVDQNSASWNPLLDWLHQIDGLRPEAVGTQAEAS